MAPPDVRSRSTIPNQASTLLPSSIFSTPTLHSAVPLEQIQPTSASKSLHSRSSKSRQRLSARCQRRTRSATLSMSGSSDGESMSDFSMEHHTIDLVDLARKDSGRIGLSRPSLIARKDIQEQQKQLDEHRSRGSSVDNHEEKADDQFMDGYEIDFGKLGEQSSSAIVNDPTRPREEIASEDDGPEDFTINMAQWIRGTGTIFKANDVRGDDAVDDEDDEGAAHSQQHLESGRLSNFHVMEESLSEPLGMSTPAPVDRYQNPLTPPTSKHGAEQVSFDDRPPFPRDDIETLHDQATEDVFQRIAALQAEVERMRSEDENRREMYDQVQRDNADLRKENADLGRQVQERGPWFSATATGLSSSSSPTDPKTTSDQECHNRDENIAEDHADMIEKIQVLEAALRASHTAVRQLRETMASNDEMHSHLVEGLREDIDRLKDEAESQNAYHADLQCTSDDLERSLRLRLSDIAELQRAAQTSEEGIKDRDLQIKHLQVEAESHANTLQVRNKRVEELECQAATLQARLDARDEDTRRFLCILEDAKGKDQILLDLNLSLKKKDAEISAKQATIAKLQEEQRNGVKAVVADQPDRDSATVLLEEQYAQKLIKIKEDSEEVISDLKRELEELRTSSEAASDTQTELRSAINVLSSKLSRAQKATHEGESNLEVAKKTAEDALQRASVAEEAAEISRQSAQEVRDAMETSKQNNELINSALEARFAKAVDAREVEWRRRVAILFRERDRMSKALMAGWGREELGSKANDADGRQAYRYKYAHR